MTLEFKWIRIVVISSCFVLLTTDCEMFAENGKRNAELEFMARVAELDVFLDPDRKITFQSLANECFDPAIVRRFKIRNSSQLPIKLCAVKMLMLWFAEPARMQYEPLNLLPVELRQLFGMQSDTVRLSYAQTEDRMTTIRLIAAISPDWGAMKPELISACRKIIEKQQLMRSIASTFVISEPSSGFEKDYLGWISAQKPLLETFQDSLEGLTVETPDEADKFSIAYRSLISRMESSHPLLIIPHASKSSDEHWISMHAQLVLALDQLLIPVEVMNWAQLLDSIKRQQWETALKKLKVIETGRPNQEVVEENRETLWRWYFKSLTKLIFWTLILVAAAFSVLYAGGIKRALPFAAGLTLLGILQKMILFQAMIPHHTPSPGHSGMLLFICVGLLVSVIALAMFTNRWVVTFFLFSAIVFSALFPSSKELAIKSAFPSLQAAITVVFLLAACVLAWMQSAWATYQLLIPSTGIERFRKIDRIVYPISMAVMLFLLLSLAGAFGWNTDHALSIEQDFKTRHSLTIALVSFQYIRYFMLRWMNLLTVVKLTMQVLFTSVLLTLSQYPDILPQIYTSPVIPILYAIAGIVLFLSYLIPLPFDLRIFRLFRKKGTTQT